MDCKFESIETSGSGGTPHHWQLKLVMLCHPVVTIGEVHQCNCSCDPLLPKDISNEALIKCGINCFMVFLTAIAFHWDLITMFCKSHHALSINFFVGKVEVSFHQEDCSQLRYQDTPTFFSSMTVRPCCHCIGEKPVVTTISMKMACISKGNHCVPLIYSGQSANPRLRRKCIPLPCLCQYCWKSSLIFSEFIHSRRGGTHNVPARICHDASMMPR